MRISSQAFRRHLGFGVALLLSAAVLPGWVGCSVNPATGERQLTLISERQEIELGRRSDEQIATSLGLYPDEGLQGYVADLGRRLAARSERPDLPWTFRVVDDPIVNAFALPGGFIYVTRGILGHLGTEAELAAVLGHEIGHVTARHSVEQVSRAQLAQIGLGVGMAASERFRQLSDLAQTGLGVLFLKFSRDDERQADDLGLRYVQRTDYDPRQMIGVFEVLERVSRAQGEGGRIPGWMSTHPTPENRIGRISDQVGQVGIAAGAVVGRNRFLRRLDGLVFGQNPREGYFRNGRFFHPELAFELRFPDGWKTSNQKQAVGAVSPGQDAVVMLTVTGAASAAEASRDFFAQEGVERGQPLRTPYRDLTALADGFSVPREQGDLRGLAVFLEHGGRVFRVLGYSPSDRFRGYEGTLEAAASSFRRVTDRRVLEVQPRRLEIVELPRAMTLDQFAQRYPSTVDLETQVLINGVPNPGTRLETGTLVKRVVGGELP